MTKKIQWLIFVITVLLFVAVYLFTQKQISDHVNRPLPERAVTVILPDISVVEVTPQTYQAQISAYGATTPRFTLALTAQVSGQVENIAERFESGFTVKKGETLVWMENSDYRAAVAEAEQQLAQSQLLFQEEERQGMQATAEWLASGIQGEPDTNLVLRKPQLASAQAAVKNAEAQLVSARKDLEFSRVTAPFDALIISRDIAPGSYAQVGTQVGMLYSTDRVEIKVSLSDREWRQLPDITTLITKDWPVNLTAVEGFGSWQGKVIRSEQHLDGTTRQRSLVIAVEQPLAQQPMLHPGMFIKVTLGGRQLENLWRLPLTSLSQRGEIWYVTEDNTLAKFASSAVFSDSDALYILPPETLAQGTQAVLVQPISSYLEGMAINPVAVQNDE